MSKVEEIIGRALGGLDGYHVRLLPDGIELDGEWTFDEIGAAVVKALGAAGYKIVTTDDAEKIEMYDVSQSYALDSTD
jgi:hypothetical protein